jgi:hypothetical protein
MAKDEPLTRLSVVRITVVTCAVYLLIAVVFVCNFFHQFIPKCDALLSLWAVGVLLVAAIHSATQAFKLIKERKVE